MASAIVRPEPPSTVACHVLWALSIVRDRQQRARRYQSFKIGRAAAVQADATYSAICATLEHLAQRIGHPEQQA